MVVRAWYMDSSEEDQRKPHQQVPNKQCPIEKLVELGVLQWHLDADKCVRGGGRRGLATYPPVAGSAPCTQAWRARPRNTR